MCQQYPCPNVSHLKTWESPSITNQILHNSNEIWKGSRTGPDTCRAAPCKCQLVGEDFGACIYTNHQDRNYAYLSARCNNSSHLLKKKGEPTDRINYQPISLYALLLYKKFLLWTENEAIWGPEESEFHRGVSAVDHCHSSIYCRLSIEAQKMACQLFPSWILEQLLTRCLGKDSGTNGINHRFASISSPWLNNYMISLQPSEMGPIWAEASSKGASLLCCYLICILII